MEAGAGRKFRLQTAQALIGSPRAASLRHRTSDRLRKALRVFKSFSLKAAPDGSMSLGITVDPEAAGPTRGISSWT